MRCLFFLAALPFFIQAAIINNPVCNLFTKPTEETDVNTQVVYGSSVELLDENDSWAKIRLDNTETGWIHKNNSQLRPVKSLFAHVYRVADLTLYPAIITLPYGSQVKLKNVNDPEERWIEIELASGQKGWIQRGDIDFHPRLKTLEEAISLSKMFLGLPYTWGGASSYGFDCSGFMLTLLKEMGLSLPHSARKQAESTYLTPIEKNELKRGDILFFGEGKITHIGLYLGDDNFLHANVRDVAPTLRISDLKTTKYNYLAARRIKQEFLPK
jgi:gamma-D-glutamyl-L-lysine dipeptidyl-peptidase